jgi:hypothetical protein
MSSCCGREAFKCTRYLIEGCNDVCIAMFLQ